MGRQDAETNRSNQGPREIRVFPRVRGLVVPQQDLRCGQIVLNRLDGDTAQRAQGRFTVEESNVFGLLSREASDRPRQVHEMRFVGRCQRMHAAFGRQVVPLTSVASAAGSDAIGPFVVAAAREWYEVIAGEALAVAQLQLASMAVLTAVSVASKEEGVGNLAAEPAGDVHELDQPDDGWFGKGEAFASDDVGAVRFDDLSFPFDHQAQRPPHRDHGQGFERGVEREAAHEIPVTARAVKS